MSGLLGVGAFGASIVTDILIKPIRQIGTIIPDVTIEETLRDELSITSHPIEYGTPITDHSYKQQREVTARYGWDNAIVPTISSLVNNLMTGTLPTISLAKSDDVYQSLLDLQNSRQPFQLSTGKNIYPTMLIASLVVNIDEKSENSLMLTCVFREIIIVKTQSATVGPQNVQSDPQKTADPVKTGANTTKPGTTTDPTQSGPEAGGFDPGDVGGGGP